MEKIEQILLTIVYFIVSVEFSDGCVHFVVLGSCSYSKYYFGAIHNKEDKSVIVSELWQRAFALCFFACKKN